MSAAWHHINCVCIEDAVTVVTKLLYSFFFFLSLLFFIPLSHQNLCLLFLGNKCEQLEALAQCAE